MDKKPEAGKRERKKIMYDVVALGELLVDFTDAGLSPDGMRLFEQNPGGAPANVLAGLGRMGLRTAFIGKVGDDLNGRFLERVLKAEKIDTSSLIFDKNHFTTLTFVSISADGERHFSFARKPGADMMLQKDEIRYDLIENAKIFHIGSLSLTDEPARTATFAALAAARRAGCIVSYDPNYRASLWQSEQKAAETIRSVLPFVDVIKLSGEEAGLVTPEKDPKAAGSYLTAHGIKAAFITLGKRGAYVFSREGGAYQPAVPGTAVDTNGAGDAFCSGVLFRIRRQNQRIEEIGLPALSEFARFGNAAASLCIEKRGAIPAMPSLREIRRRLGARDEPA